MISDFCMSLSRKKEDKVNGTARIHIMKNRFGIDGITYNATIDTAISTVKLLDSYDGEEPKEFSNKVTSFDKQKLANEFFQNKMKF